MPKGTRGYRDAKNLAHLLGKSMDKVFQQHQNVVLPLAKRGNLDREYV
jgi:hypothetical protein